MVIRFVLLISTAVWVTVACRETPLLLSFLLLAVFLLILTDFLRLRSRPVRKHQVLYFFLSFCLCIFILAVNNRTEYLQIYYFFLLDDIFNMRGGKMPKVLIAAHFAGFMGVECYALYVIKNADSSRDFTDGFVVFASYVLVLLVFAVIHYFKRERERLKVLNANLMEYSFQEREYLLAKERSRISQELHDSLGHSLMAVLMNVRYLKAIEDKSQEERNRQTGEIEELLKECVANLRSSVYSLKELDDSIDLREEIGRIVGKFNELGLVKIRLDYDDKADKAPNHVKAVLHKTIREGVTNSIRHGSPTFIYLSIRCVNDLIELIVRDNGSGCGDIHPSFGLNGIAGRVKETGGEVWFTSAKNKGFTIRALLPGGNKV